MANPLKVAVCGTGLIADVKHIPAWQKIASKAKLECICDLNEEAARKVADKFGIPKVYTDFAKMLADEKPDIVDICTPPKTHKFLAVQAMDAGANAMIEKPMAMDVEESDAIIEARDRNGVSVMCCHSDLFYLSFMKARQMIESGEIGDFRGMRIFLSTPTHYITAKEDHWGNKLPGGVIGETGPHLVYMTLPFIPEIREVGVVAAKLLDEYPWSPFEDYRITLRGDKALCSITAAYTSDEWLCQVEMIGSDAVLRLDLETQSVVKYTRDNIKASTAAFSQLSEAGQLLKNTFAVGTRYATGAVPSSHDLMCEQFTDSIINKTKSPVPAEEGRETVRVLKEIVDQLESKYPQPLADAAAHHAKADEAKSSAA
ncbi:MAG: Gfo/Idh/MocA family oxidoreductase [Planctomycetota bacterium]